MLLTRRWPRFLAAFAGLAALTLVATGCNVGSWTVVGGHTVNGLSQGQGLATVTRPDGSTYQYFDGDTTVPGDLAKAGWNHVGDPDSLDGYIFEPFQAADSATAAKLFRVTNASGGHVDFVHQDVSGEAYNNSFVAISPDGQWMVSGEWDTEPRLLVYPTPILNLSASDPSKNLPLAGQITLDKPIVDIQGCAFQTATRLLCTSDDPVAENGLPRKSLLQIDLAQPLNGTDVAGTVTPIGPLPLVSSCPVTQPGSWPGDFEVEGDDVDHQTGLLWVIVLPPGACALNNAALYALAPPK